MPVSAVGTMKSSMSMPGEAAAGAVAAPVASAQTAAVTQTKCRLSTFMRRAYAVRRVRTSSRRRRRARARLRRLQHGGGELGLGLGDRGAMLADRDGDVSVELARDRRARRVRKHAHHLAHEVGFQHAVDDVQRVVLLLRRRAQDGRAA